MFRRVSCCLGGAVTRSSAAVKASAAAAGAKRKGRGRSPKSPGARRTQSPTNKTVRAASKAAKSTSSAIAAPATNAHVRPGYMSEKREKEVLVMADRMQQRDISGDVPVASFAFDILKAHPSVRDMGLRERMDFLCTRWAKLPAKKRLEYLNDPLKGLM